MISIQISNARLVLGARTLFSDLNWTIQHDQKIGLVGANGAGKSSLFKLITGEYGPEPGGAISRARGVTLGYLPQQPELDPQQTVYAAAMAGRQRWSEVQVELEAVEASLGDPQTLERALDQQARLLDEYKAQGGDGYPAKAAEALNGLGLARADFDKPVGRLSGGQKKLAGLASLLLDEPDNHLDLAGKAFLERLIAGYEGAVVIISHDRYFLDRTVRRIWALEDGRVRSYPGGNSDYLSATRK